MNPAILASLREHGIDARPDRIREVGGGSISRAVRLLERLELFCQDYVPAPSLLHGDLWAGNWGADRSGQPWLFDPAVHFGDREADIAMTRLFGGFGPGFYRAYEQEWPLDTGAQQRCTSCTTCSITSIFSAALTCHR